MSATEGILPIKTKDPLFTGGLMVLLGVALLHFLLHILAGPGYGMFRDEFYYIECARHLDWGYVDHPPFSIAVLAGSIAVFGDSVQAIRLIPALLGVLLIVLVWFMTGDLGGGLAAKTIAAMAAAVAPELLGLTGFYSMNAFDVLFWAMGYAVLIQILKTGDEKLWLWLGAVAGIGLLNKISMLFFLFSLVVSLLLTAGLKRFRNKMIWIGGAIALMLFLPYVLWQIPKHWPTLQFMANAQKYKIADLSPPSFIMSSVLSMHPLNVLIWLPGLGFLLFAPRMRTYRILGFVFLITLAVLLIQKSKPYYLASAYSVLFAAGGVSVEWMTRNRRLHWLRFAAVILLIVGGAATVPFAVPVLPVNRFIAYQKAAGIHPAHEENNRLGELPQFYADCFGWENMARTVSGVYRNLTPEQKADCAVFGRNYGEAGAVNYFRSKYELPQAISEHNNCYFWGPGKATGRTIIAIGINPEEWKKEYESVTLAGTVVSPYAMPYETNLPVYVCLGLKIPIQRAWGPPNFL
jgi:hypothetical protein